MKLTGYLKLDSLLAKFLVDYTLYKGRYDDSLHRVQQDDSLQLLAKNIRIASILYTKKNYTVK